MSADNLGVYVHIPYCRRKCLYCDFYSEGSSRADWNRYVTAVLKEFEWKLSRFHPKTSRFSIYIGGGTPSLIPEEQFRRLSEGLISTAGRMPDEFTIEVNPDDVTAKKGKVWKESGVNRISIGLQSLSDKELKAVGRRHDATTAREAYSILREIFRNISLDIIFGLPYQTSESLETTLRGIIEMNPEHISAYSLMYEERTALTKLRDSGKIDEIDEDITVGMFRMVSNCLKEAGYDQYEISNYAKPGFRSQHNSSYWYGQPYIGLGAGAHGYDGHRIRSYCLPSATLYTELWNKSEFSESIITEKLYREEQLSDEELREEIIMTRLRTSQGINLTEYGEKYDVEALLAKSLNYIDKGLLKKERQHLALTTEGIMVCDEIITDLF